MTQMRYAYDIARKLDASVRALKEKYSRKGKPLTPEVIVDKLTEEDARYEQLQFLNPGFFFAAMDGKALLAGPFSRSC